MNTPRAVLQSPKTYSPTSQMTQYVRSLCMSIVMISAPLDAAEAKHEETQTSRTTDVPGEVLAQVFEGFTPKLKYDPEHSTWNIGYGTDIGQKKSTWPYGTYAEDVANYMLQKGLSRETIRDIFQGKETITTELAKSLFDLRYNRRKTMLSSHYETLYQKKFADLPEEVQKMLVDFSYNMRGEYGILPAPGFLGFPEACKALQAENWPKLAHEIAESTYADQVGPRRAGYWVEQLVALSGKPLKTMTSDVKQEVKSFKKVQPEVEARIEMILAYNNQKNRP